MSNVLGARMFHALDICNEQVSLAHVFAIAGRR